MSIDSYLKSAVVILSAALIGGCTFEPHNENINPIKPPEPIVFSIEVNDPNFTDPYYLVLPTLFTFTLKDLPQPVCYYDVYLDGGTHITSGEAHDRISFQMIPGAYTDGIHEVTIKIRVPTNSGSLAEKFDSEFHLTEIKFKVIIDRTTPTFAAPPTVAYENGFLTVRWGAAPRRNFFYVIKRTYEPYNPLMDSLIFNPSQNSFVDRGFVGGDITYKILASGYGFQDVEVGTIRFNDSPVDFKIVRKDQLVYLSWSQSEIGLEDTKITSSANGTEVTLPHTESAEILIDSLVMGEEENYFIKTVRDRYPIQGFTQIKNLKTLPNLKEYKSFAMLPHQNKMLVASSNSIYRYRLSDLVIEDSLSIQDASASNFSMIVVSEDETKAVVVGGPGKLIGFDPFDFKNQIAYGIHSASQPITFGDEIWELVLGNLSNDGLLTMTLATYYGRWGVVYNTNTNNLVWNSSKFIYLNPVRPPAISVDGNYMVYDIPATASGQVFTRSADQFVALGTVESGPKFFRNIQNELITTPVIEPYIAPTNPQISVYDLSSPPDQPAQQFSKVRVFTLPGIVGDEYLWETGFDNTTQTLYTRYLRNAFSVIRLHDVNDFEQTAVMEAMSYTTHSHNYSNNYHLTSRGYIETVK